MGYRGDSENFENWKELAILATQKAQVGFTLGFAPTRHGWPQTCKNKRLPYLEYAWGIETLRLLVESKW
jgi:hypothetical protein